MVGPVQSSSSQYSTTPLNSDQRNINSQDQVVIDSSDEKTNVESAAQPQNELAPVNEFFNNAINVKNQKIIKLQQSTEVYEKKIISHQKRFIGVKETDLAIFKKFQNGKIKILPKFTIPGLMRVLENEMGDYEATDRARAAAILGQQPALSKDVLSILKKVLERQNEDKWVKIQSAIALSHYEPLSDEYIEILLDDIEHPTGNYEIAYRVDAAIALIEQPELSQEVCARLENALQKEDKNIHLRAAISLRERLPGKALPILLDTVKNKDNPAVDRANAVYALSKETIWDKETRSVLEKAFVEPNQDRWIKVEIAIALSFYADLSEVQVQILLDTIEDKRCPIGYRNDAAFALRRLSILSEKARLALEEVLHDEDIRVYAAVALGSCTQLSEIQMQSLLDVVENKSRQHMIEPRFLAMSILGDQTKALSDKSQSALREVLKDSNSILKIQAASVLIRKKVLDDKIASILIKAVGNNQYTDGLRQSATFVLGEQPAALPEIDGAQSALKVALKDSSSSVKIQAAVALVQKKIFDEEIASILVEAVGNEQYENVLRGNAAFALGEQPNALSEIEGAQSALKAALEGPNSYVKIQAAVALAKKALALGEVIPLLIEVVGNNQYVDSFISGAIWALSAAQPNVLSNGTQLALRKALKGPNGSVKIIAALVLAQKKVFDDEIASILVEAIANNQYVDWLRGAAASMLAEQSTALSEIHGARSALEAALKDPNSRVRIEAAVALARKNDVFGNEVIPILVEAVGDNQYDSELRGGAAWLLGEQPTALLDNAQSALREALKDSDSRIKVQAAVALARKNVFDDEIIFILVKIVGNNQYPDWFRGHAAFALGEQPTALSEIDGARSVLEEALEDSASIVKIQAAIALAKKALALDKVVPILGVILKDSDDIVKMLAAVVLAQKILVLGKVASILIEVVGNEQYDNALRGNAAFALGKQPSALSEIDGAQSALEAALKDPASIVKIQAAVALANKNVFDDEIASILVDALDNNQCVDGLSGSAAFALGEQSTAALFDGIQSALREALKDPNSIVKILEAAILAKKTLALSEVMPILIEAVGNNQYVDWLIGNAARAPGERPIALSNGAHLTLRKVLKGPNGSVKILAALVLAQKKFFNNEITSILVEAVGNNQYDDSLRGLAAFALGKQPTGLSDGARSALEAVLGNSAPIVKIEAAVALARKKDVFGNEVIPILVEAVGNNQYDNLLRIRAAFALGEQPTALSNDAQLALREALEDSAIIVKSQAAVALARKNVFDDKIISILVEVVGNNHYADWFRGHAAYALGKQPTVLSEIDGAQSALEAALEDSDSIVKIEAAAALAKKTLVLGKVMPILVEAVGNNQYDDRLRGHAAFALGKQPIALSEIEGAQSALEAALKDPASIVKIQAAVALTRKNVFDEEIASILVEALGNNQCANVLIGNAAWALGEQPTALSKIDGALSALKAALKDPNISIKIQAAVTLARKDVFDEEIASILVEALGNKRCDNLLRGNAAFALGEQSTVLSGIKDAQSALEATLKDSNSLVKIEAAVALARKNIFSNEVIPILVEVVGNNQYENVLRGHAAWALGEQPTALSEIDGARSALEVVLKNFDSIVKSQAAVALARKNVFNNEIVSTLAKVVGNNQYDKVLRGNAAYAFNLKPELLKKEDIRLTLKAALNDSDYRVKHYASEALKKYELTQQKSWLSFLNF